MINGEMKKYYDVLGINDEATDQEVNKEYIERLKKWESPPHYPNLTPKKISEIIEAYERIMAYRNAKKQRIAEAAKFDTTKKVTQEIREEKRKISLDNETKKCPFCAELIKLEAIKCRYCLTDFNLIDVAKETELSRTLLEQKITPRKELEERIKKVEQRTKSRPKEDSKITEEPSPRSSLQQSTVVTPPIEKNYKKAAAAWALGWALGLSAGYIIGPLIVNLVYGADNLGHRMAMKVVTGIALFPVIFVVLLIWRIYMKKDQTINNGAQSHGQSSTPQSSPRSSPRQSTQLQQEKIKGVGGWLSLLIFQMVFATPFWALVLLASGYKEIEPYRDQFPGLSTIQHIATFIGVAVAIFAIIAGMKLWKIKPNAIGTAKNYFKTVAVCNIILSILPFMAGLPSEANSAILNKIIPSTVVNFISIAIWYAYLCKSKRVASTYSTHVYQEGNL